MFPSIVICTVTGHIKTTLLIQYYCRISTSTYVPAHSHSYLVAPRTKLHELRLVLPEVAIYSSMVYRVCDIGTSTRSPHF
jgi:hypothetical protein